MATRLRFAPIAATLVLAASHAHAFFFVFPIPNLAKPTALQSLIDALEKSTDTKAVAYVSENKTFGGKMWAWGHHAGVATQEEANSRAMRSCEASLARAKAQYAGGQPLYDFGDKKCELHEFSNKTVNLPPPPQPVISTVPPVAAPIVEPVSATPSNAAPTLTTFPSPPSGSQESDITSRLKQLRSLLEQNLITQEEFDKKRKELLDRL